MDLCIKKTLPLLLSTLLALPNGQARAEIGLLTSADGSVMGGAGQYPDGRNSSQAVVLWNPRTEKLIGRYGTEISNHTCAALSDDGTVLAIAGQVAEPESVQVPQNKSLGARGFASGFRDAFRKETPALYVWNTKTNKIVLKLELNGATVNALKFSPDGKTLAAGCNDCIIRAWDIPSGKSSKRLSGAELPITCLAFSSIDNNLYSKEDSQDRSVVRRWSIETGKQLSTFSIEVPIALTTPATSMKLSRNGDLLIIGNVFSILKIVDPSLGKETKTFDRSGAFALSPDGTTLAIADDCGKVNVRSLKTNSNVGSLVGHSDLPSPYNRVVFVEFCDKGLKLITGGTDGTFRIWDAASGKRLSTFQSIPSGITDTAFDATGKTLVTGSYRGEIQILDCPTGKKLREIQLTEPSEQIMLPPNKDLIVTKSEKSVQLYSIGTGRFVNKLATKGRVSAIDGSSDGEKIAVGLFNGNVDLFDTNGSALSQLVSGSAKPITCLRFSRDGSLIATGSQDGKVRLWSIPEGKLLFTLDSRDRINAIDFCSVNRQLVSVDSNGLLKLWDVDTGRLLSSFRLPQGNCCSIATTADGRRLATSSYSLQSPNFIRIWELPFAVPAPEILQIPTEMDLTPGLHFSPDGKFITGGSSFGRVQLWNTTTGQKRIISEFQ